MLVKIGQLVYGQFVILNCHLKEIVDDTTTDIDPNSSISALVS